MELDFIQQVDEAQKNAQDTRDLLISSRIHHVSKKYGSLVSEDNDMMIIEDDESTNYEDVLLDVDSQKWLEAMKSEMESISSKMLQNKVRN